MFRGTDGLDEISTVEPSDLWELREGKVIHSLFDPADYGIPRTSLDALRGGSLEDNVRLAKEVLDGDEGPCRDVVVVNAAAGIIAADLATEFSQAIEQAQDSIGSGRARATLQRLVDVSNSVAA